MILTKIKNVDYSQYINYIAVAYAFTLPLSRAAISLFGILFIVLWILEGNFKKKYVFLIQSKMVLALLAFLFFNILALLWSDDVVKALSYIKKYWYLIPILVMLTSLKKEYIPKIVSAFILGMLISEVISYGVFFELWQFKYATPTNLSPFMHHIEYSIFLAFTALLLLGRIFNNGTIGSKIFYTLFFITVSGNLFLTEGRTGQFAFIFGLFVLAMISFRNRFKSISIFLVLAGIMLILAFNLSTTFHDRTIMGKESLISVVQNEDYCTSLGSRVGAWIISKDIVIHNPALGVGIYDNMREFHTIIDEKYPKMQCMHNTFMHVHNQYLQVLTQLGFVGLFFFLAIFYSLVKLPIDNRELKNMKYVYLTILLFAFMAEVVFHRQFSMALFTLVAGLLLAQNRIENEI